MGNTESEIVYHGTSYSSAQSIKQNGFNESSRGCLGQGVYFAEYEKAKRFATDWKRTGSRQGAILKCKITYRNIKRMLKNRWFNDDSWQDEGYDAAYVKKTTISSNPEWVVVSSDQVEVLSIEQVSSNECTLI